MWTFQRYTAKVPALMAVQWSPDIGMTGLVTVNNGYDQTYAFLQPSHLAYGKLGHCAGQIGDYIVYEPGEDRYYFLSRHEFERDFVKGTE